MVCDVAEPCGSPSGVDPLAEQYQSECGPSPSGVDGPNELNGNDTATTDQKLYEARRKILLNASEALGALGEELVPMTSGETGAPSTWEVVTVPAAELPVPELPDDLIGAERVTRVKDSRGDNYVAWFPRRLKGYLTGEVKGRNEPIREGARSIWYQVAKYGQRGAELMAKRHLKRPETRRAMWQRLQEQEEEDPVEPKPTRRRLRGKQNTSLEGRVGPEQQKSNNTEEETSNNTVGLVDLFGGVSSLRVALKAAGRHQQRFI